MATLKIKLLGVHSSTFNGDHKMKLSALPYPVDVEVEQEGEAYYVISPEQYEGHIAWYITDTPFLNRFVKEYWETGNQIQNI